MSTSDPAAFERRFASFLDTMADEVPAVRYRAPRTMLRRAHAKVMATTAAGVMLAGALASGGALIGRAMHGGRGPVPGSGGTSTGGFLTTGSNGSSGAAGSNGAQSGGVTVGGVPGAGYLAPFGPSGHFGETRRGPDGGGWDRRSIAPGSGGQVGSGESPGSKQGGPGEGSSGSSGNGFWWNPPGSVGSGGDGGDGGIGLLDSPLNGSSTGTRAGEGVGEIELGAAVDASNVGTAGSVPAARHASEHRARKRAHRS